MGPIATRRLIGRLRRQLYGVMVLLALGAAIAAHHGGGQALADMDGHHAPTVVAAVCVGVLLAVGAAVAPVTLGALRLAPWRDLGPTGRPWGTDDPARVDLRTRAGPASLPVLCVWRR